MEGKSQGKRGVNPLLVERTEAFIADAKKKPDCVGMLSLLSPEYSEDGRHSEIHFKEKPRSLKQLNDLHHTVATIGDRVRLRVDAGYGDHHSPYEILSRSERHVAHTLISLYKLSI